MNSKIFGLLKINPQTLFYTTFKRMFPWENEIRSYSHENLH